MSKFFFNEYFSGSVKNKLNFLYSHDKLNHEKLTIDNFPSQYFPNFKKPQFKYGFSNETKDKNLRTSRNAEIPKI